TDRTEARREALTHACRLPGRPEGEEGSGGPGEAPGAIDRGGREGNARQVEARPQAAPEAQGLQGRDPPARRAEAPGSGGSEADGRPAQDGGNLTVEIQHKATGRRKTSMARVRMVPGTGAITINQRPLHDYYPNHVLKVIIKQPLLSVEAAEKFDIYVRVAGGRASGQAGTSGHGF